MCFSPQRRAIFLHRNFKKWSEAEVFCTFSLENMLLATAACNFSTSQLQKVLRTWHVLYIFTWKCASRHSGVQFFNISTSKSAPRMLVFCTFSLENMLLATAACNFSTSQLQKVVRTWHVLYIFTWKCASRHSGVQFFISPLTTGLRTRRFNEPTFRLTRHTNHWKNTAFRDFSNIWRGCIFFLLTFAQLHLLSSDFTSSHLLFICFSTLHIVGRLLFKLPSTTLALLCTTKYYYIVLLQYFSVLQSTTPVLLRTTKYYASTTLYYKVLLQYYSVIQSTTPYYKVLLR